MGVAGNTFQRSSAKSAVLAASLAALLGGVAARSHGLLAGLVILAVLVAGRRVGSFLEEARTIVARLSVAVVVLSAVRPPFDLWVRSAAIGGVVALAFAAITAFHRSRTAGTISEPTLLVGDAEAVKAAAMLFSNYPTHGVRPVATATPDGFLPTVLPGGTIDNLTGLIAQYGITHVITVSPNVSEKLVLGRERPIGVRLSTLPPLAEILTGEVEVVNVRGLPFVTLAPRRLPHGPAWAAKRGFDFAAASVGMLLVLPLLAAASIAVRLDSPGPIFFRQKRVGRNGRLFDVWKFRSMVQDAEAQLADLLHRNEAAGAYFKLENDPRVTRVGKWLRRLSIDELPQLINVLRGEMSLVGPRPFLPSELAADPEAFEWRLPFLPGITGLWQIAGRSWLPRLEGLRMDLSYVEHWSLGLDLRILFRTLAVAVRNDRRPPVEGQDLTVGLDRSKYMGLVEGDDLCPANRDVDVSIVIVTHESANDIEACLASLARVKDDCSREVIVVDNASADGTADLIENSGYDVRVIRKRGRDGFSTNTNIGAIAGAGRHVMLLNPDTRVFDGAIDQLVAYLDANSDVGAVGPRLLYPDGRLQHSARRFPSFLATVVRRTPLRLVLPETQATRRHLMTDLTDGGTSDVDWLLGAAVAVRGDAFRELDGLDDGFRLYCEDIDLSWRLHDSGWKVRYLPTAVVEHDLGELTSKRFFTVRTLWHFRSMARFVRLHGFRRPARERSTRGLILSSARTTTARLADPVRFMESAPPIASA